MQLAMDGHIHLYECYDLDVALCSLHDRLRQAAPEADHLGGILMEREGGGLFAHAERSGEMPSCPWKVRSLTPGRVLSCTRESSASDPARELLLVAGRQVVVREGFEVLSVGRTAEIAEGMSADESCEAMRAAGGVPVLSWAFGKWWLKRALPVARLMRRQRRRGLALGDTTIRPRGLFSTYLALGALVGDSILPGTDPLPFPAEASKLGQLGFLAECAAAPAAIGDWLQQQLLGETPAAWRVIGSRDGFSEVMKRRKAYQRYAEADASPVDWQRLAGEHRA